HAAVFHATSPAGHEPRRKGGGIGDLRGGRDGRWAVVCQPTDGQACRGAGRRAGQRGKQPAGACGDSQHRLRALAQAGILRRHGTTDARAHGAAGAGSAGPTGDGAGV
ncbi:hypothetical protein IWW55_006307, partial [Coemansia sp. RSA 2706]